MVIRRSHAPLAGIIILIFFLGFALRLVATNPGYLLFHPDEGNLHGLARRIILEGNFRPFDYHYGSLLPIVYAIFFRSFFLPIQFIISTITNFPVLIETGKLGSVRYFLENEIARSGDYFDTVHNYVAYWARYTSAFLGALTILVLYVLGKTLFGRKVGIIAAFLLAVNYRHVVSSSLALVDAPVGLFAALSLLLSFRLLRHQKTRDYLLAGVGVGLCFSIKYFIYALGPLFLCHFFAVKKVRSFLFDKKIWLSLLASVALYAALNPYSLIDYKEAYRQVRFLADVYDVFPLAKIFANNLSLKQFYYFVFYGMGVSLTIATLLGYGYALLRYAKKTLIVSSVVVPFVFLFIVVGKASPVHNHASIIPLLLLFPALLVADLSEHVRSRKRSLLILVAAMLILGLPSLKDSVLYSYYSAQPQNASALARWLEDNLPYHSSVAGAWNVFFPSQRGYTYTQMDHFRRLNISLQELHEKGIDWVFDTMGYIVGMNDDYLLDNALMRSVFFDRKKFWEFMDNTYLTLSMEELADWRVTQFSKPSWQPIEPAAFAAKLPRFPEPTRWQPIVSYDFETASQRNGWTVSSFMPRSSYHMGFEPEGYKNTIGAVLYPDTCTYQTKISSPLFPVLGHAWYEATGIVSPKGDHPVKEGFLRLDFQSADNTLLKTFVSRYSQGADVWDTLKASGISPDDAATATISFQVDFCYRNQRYVLDNFFVRMSDEVPVVDPKVYPYYGKKVPQNFIWIPNRWL